MLDVVYLAAFNQEYVQHCECSFPALVSSDHTTLLAQLGLLVLVISRFCELRLNIDIHRQIIRAAGGTGPSRASGENIAVGLFSAINILLKVQSKVREYN